MPWTAVCLAVLTATAGAGERVFYRDVNVRLSGGLVRPDGNPADIELYLGVRPAADGSWQWSRGLMGWAGKKMVGWAEDGSRAFNQMDHTGTVTVVRDDSKTIRLELDVTVNPDPWVAGGPARYVLELARDGERLAGTFTGTFKGQPVKGTASGTQRAAPWPGPDAKYAMHAPGEHPRLIIRKDDLPALKARAAAPHGQALLARLNETLARPWTLWHPMGWAFKYQLTGDRKWAEKAREEVEAARQGKQQKDSRYSYTKPGGKLRAGSSYAAIAMAYDLCYDVWDPAYRQALAKEIQEKVWPIFNTGKSYSP
jgi:hypothetical protein